VSADLPGVLPPVRIPKDWKERADLANFAGLSDDERAALDAWCALEQREYEARLRRAMERDGDLPMASASDEKA
jgi:hypothetical protein